MYTQLLQEIRNPDAPLAAKFYYLAFGLMTFRGVLGLSNLDVRPLSVITYVAMALLFAKLLLTKYRPREILMIAVFLLIGVLIFIKTRNNGILITIATVLGAKNINLKKIMRICFAVFFVTCVIIVLLSLIGIAGNSVMSTQRFGIIQRNSLGFIHPNILHAMFSIISTLYLYLHYQKIRPLHFAVICVLNVGMFLATGSRTGCLTLFCVILFMAFFKARGEDSVLMKYSFVIFLAISLSMILMSALFPYVHVLSGINTLLQGRLEQANYYLSKYSVHPFGSHIVELDPGYKFWHNELDCGYARLFINYGWVYTGIYIALNAATLYRMSKNNRQRNVVLILTFVFAGIAENYISYIYMNMALLFWKYLLFGDTLYEIGSLNRFFRMLSRRGGIYASIERIFRKCTRIWIEP